MTFEPFLENPFNHFDQLLNIHGKVEFLLPIVCFHLQVKDLRERIEEAESMGVRRMKAQLSAMEGRISSLEEQLDSATR